MLVRFRRMFYWLFVIYPMSYNTYFETLQKVLNIVYEFMGYKNNSPAARGMVRF